MIILIRLPRGHCKVGCQGVRHPCEEGQVVLDNTYHDTEARYYVSIDREGQELLDGACNKLEENRAHTKNLKR